MDNTTYQEATAIKIEKKHINDLLALVVLNKFDQADLISIYTALEVPEEYLDYVGKIYTSAPTVVIEGDGADAEAVAVLTDGIVTDVNVTVPGHDYTTAEIVFSGGGGAGAAAHALIGGSGDSITDIVVDQLSLVARLKTKITELDAEFAGL